MGDFYILENVVLSAVVIKIMICPLKMVFIKKERYIVVATVHINMSPYDWLQATHQTDQTTLLSHSCVRVRVCVCLTYPNKNSKDICKEHLYAHIHSVCFHRLRLQDPWHARKIWKSWQQSQHRMFFKIKSWPCSRATACSTVNYFIESFVQTSPQGVRTAESPNYHISVMLGHAKKEMRPISPWQSCRVLNRPASQD